MIYITGDTHIPIDIHKLSRVNFPEQKQMTKNDFIIVCGDFGGVWNNSKEELYWRDWLNDRNFTTLFVDGNHENFDLLNSHEIENFYGGKIHIICNTVYHLMRGQVFDFNGVKIFTMGGAKSTDKEWRRENISWWKEELPNYQEYEEAINNLDKNNWCVDYIITHTGPLSVTYQFNRFDMDSRLEDFLDQIGEQMTYKHWYFGHFHRDQQIDEKHTVIYKQIIKIV